MATNLLPLNPVSIRAGPQKPDPNRRKTTSSWWSPVFGWSTEPDYIGPVKKENGSESDPKEARSRFVPGGFTEEKAKQLRMMTSDTSSFHDMYHSAIASRMASDFKGRSDR
ncbi:hypothetical protein M5689_011320 [Euphorbia peplus]|nr:hypothetical protein M5689_011320 [Euphorbia peplus]